MGKWNGVVAEDTKDNKWFGQVLRDVSKEGLSSQLTNIPSEG